MGIPELVELIGLQDFGVCGSGVSKLGVLKLQLESG